MGTKLENDCWRPFTHPVRDEWMKKWTNDFSRIEWVMKYEVYVTFSH